MKKWTLQARITLIVGVILAAACILLTANSLFAANTYYGDYAAMMEAGLIEVDSAAPGGGSELVVSEANESYREATDKFSGQSVLGLVLIAIAAVAITYWVTGRTMKPLRELTGSVGKVDDRNLHERLELPGAQGEVLALEESFNRMLGRLEDAFLIQKNFASNAAHELKTPLAVIKSSLQVLEMNQRPGEVDYREFMQDTKEGLERIIKTVDGLLALATPDAGSADEAVALRPLLSQAAGELSAQAKESGVSLSVLEGEDMTVRGNPNLLYRAFYNLVENAVKYNRPGGTVKVTLERQGGKAAVRIEDTGPGIGAEELRHIFEPFYRADPSRSQRIPGSGLGLSVVKTILERHRGEVEVQSKPGEGTVFTVTLPQA